MLLLNFIQIQVIYNMDNDYNHTNDLMNDEYNALSIHRGKIDTEVFQYPI